MGMENVDNLLRKNSIHLHGLKEFAEGEDLVGFLELFTGFVGSDVDFSVSVLAAYRLGFLNRSRKIPRDIVLQFLDWETKSLVLKQLEREPSITIGDLQLSIYSDFEFNYYSEKKKLYISYVTSSERTDNLSVGFSLQTYSGMQQEKCDNQDNKEEEH